MNAAEFGISDEVVRLTGDGEQNIFLDKVLKGVYGDKGVLYSSCRLKEVIEYIACKDLESVVNHPELLALYLKIRKVKEKWMRLHLHQQSFRDYCSSIIKRFSLFIPVVYALYIWIKRPASSRAFFIMINGVYTLPLLYYIHSVNCLKSVNLTKKVVESSSNIKKFVLYIKDNDIHLGFALDRKQFVSFYNYLDKMERELLNPQSVNLNPVQLEHGIPELDVNEIKMVNNPNEFISEIAKVVLCLESMIDRDALGLDSSVFNRLRIRWHKAFCLTHIILTVAIYYFFLKNCDDKQDPLDPFLYACALFLPVVLIPNIIKYSREDIEDDKPLDREIKVISSKTPPAHKMFIIGEKSVEDVSSDEEEIIEEDKQIHYTF